MSGCEQTVRAMGERARLAAGKLARLSGAERANIAREMGTALANARAEILAANARDMEQGRAAGLSSAMLDRLELTEARITALAKAVSDVAHLPDPVGEILDETRRSNGLVIRRTRVPIGVIAIIYESRPNVTADAAVLCVRSGNAVILRGGSEAVHSNIAIARALSEGGARAGMPTGSVQIVESTDRDAIRTLVQLEGLVDCVIPRGGEGLIRAVAEMARVPVIKHYKGVCHTYVDASANLEMALTISENAKCQRPGVCNAMETLLVHQAVATKFLPAFAARVARYPVEMRGDARAMKLVPTMKSATEEDWYEEYLDLILAVRVVDSVDDAIAHIEKYGSRHSDAIIAEDATAQRAFVDGVDSAAVYVNASTRFTDGGEFGMGAEIGISTDKLHARGPMGLRELTTYKYVVEGSGQIRT